MPPHPNFTPQDGKQIDKVVGVEAPKLEKKIAEYSAPSA